MSCRHSKMPVAAIVPPTRNSTVDRQPREPPTKPLKRVVGVDTYTPLAGAALLVLPGDADIVAAAKTLAS